MAERLPRVVIVAPGGRGLRRALFDLTTRQTVVTAMEDTSLHAAKQILADHEVDEFLPFGNCVGRFAAMCGDTGFPRLTGPQAVHLAQRTAGSLPYDNPLHAAFTSYRYARAIVQVITELRHNAWSPEKLALAAARVEDPITQERLRLLAEFIDQFDRNVESSQREYASERAEFCMAHSAKVHSPIKHLVVLLTGQSAPIYNDWIRWVARQGVRVDCIIAASTQEGSPFQPELDWANLIGEVEDWSRAEPLWSDQLFLAEPGEPLDFEVKGLVTGDSLSECEWVVRRIIALQNQGVTPARIGVFIRGNPQLSLLFHCAADRLGVPLSGSRVAALSSNGFVAAARDLLEAMASPDVRKLRSCLSNSYFGLSPEVQESLNRTLIQIQASSDDPWAELGVAVVEELETAWLAQLIKWRANALAGPKPLPIWANLIHSLWDRTPILDRAVTGPHEAILRDQHAWTVMQRTIRDAALARGHDEPVDFDQFLVIAQTLWQEEKIIWPATNGHVRLCTSINDLVDFEHLFVLNMLEGNLPKRRQQDPVLDDIDRGILNQMGDYDLPLSDLVTTRERALFLTLCATPSISLTLSWSLASDDRDNIQSFYIDEIERVFGDKFVVTKIPRTQVTPTAEDSVSSPDRRLSEALVGPRDDFARPMVNDARVRELIASAFDEVLDIQEVARAAACPFRAAIYHRLKLRLPDRSLPIAMLRAIPRRAGLISQPTNAAASKAMRAVADELMEEHLNQMDGYEQILFRDAQERLISGWATREFSVRNLLSSDDLKTFTKYQSGSDAKEIMGNLYKFSADCVYVFGGKQIAFYYADFQIPDERNEASDTEGMVRIQLLLKLMKPKSEAAISAILVESLDGPRTLITQSDKLKLFTKGLKTMLITEDSKWFTDEILERKVSTARQVIGRGSAEPTSGLHCERCSLGDLCRSHNDWGETQIDFGGGS
jgi:hypothetical protein